MPQRKAVPARKRAVSPKSTARKAAKAAKPSQTDDKAPKALLKADKAPARRPQPGAFRRVVDKISQSLDRVEAWAGAVDAFARPIPDYPTGVIANTPHGPLDRRTPKRG